MLKVWGRTNSINVQKVMWTVAELGLAHERIDAGGPLGGVDTPGYRAMNPNALIPTIDDGGFVLWESNVIVRYLAAKHGAGTLCPTGIEMRAVAEQWMDWQQTTLQPDLRTVFWALVRNLPEKRDPSAVAAATRSLASIWQRLDDRLGRHPFVAGDRLTMGDVPVGAACHRYFALGVERPPFPHLTAWYERLQQRPGYRAHVMLPLS